MRAPDFQAILRSSCWIPAAINACLLSLLLSPPAVAAGSLQLSLPAHRLQADELAVIVNDADPLSVQIGAYYMKARHLPAGNLLHVSFPPGRAGMPAADFNRLRTTSRTGDTGKHPGLCHHLDRTLPRRVHVHHLGADLWL